MVKVKSTEVKCGLRLVSPQHFDHVVDKSKDHGKIRRFVNCNWNGTQSELTQKAVSRQLIYMWKSIMLNVTKPFSNDSLPLFFKYLENKRSQLPMNNFNASCTVCKYVTPFTRVGLTEIERVSNALDIRARCYNLYGHHPGRSNFSNWLRGEWYQDMVKNIILPVTNNTENERSCLLLIRDSIRYWDGWTTKESGAHM